MKAILIPTLSVLILSGCTNFMCDHCQSPHAYRQELNAYQKAPRIQTVPNHIDAGYSLYDSIELIKTPSGIRILPTRHTRDWRTNADFVYYEGMFTNPLPITTPQGERLMLDFRLDGGLDNKPNVGTVYLLDAHGQNPNAPKFRPTPVGRFTME